MVDRLQLDTILAGICPSYNLIVPYICNTISAQDDFVYHYHDLIDVPYRRDFEVVDVYTWDNLRLIIKKRQDLLEEILFSISHLGMPPDECKAICEEARDSFELMAETCTLLRSRKYVMVILGTTRELVINRVFPAQRIDHGKEDKKGE